MNITTESNRALPRIGYFTTALCVSICLIFITGCRDSGVLYTESHEVQESGWSKDAELVFKIPVTDIEKSLTVLFVLQHNESYRFSNCWLFVEIESPTGEKGNGKAELILADEQGWLGRKALSVYEFTAPFSQFTFHEAGTYTFRISQGMRTDVLTDISKLSLQLIETKEVH